MAAPEADGDSPPAHVKTLQYTRRGLKMVGHDKSLFDLDEPVWHADEKSPVCDKCSEHFTFTHRRHHCRRCGEVVCNNCSDKAHLTRMGYVDPVLVCKDCATTCKSEEEFFQHHLKTLTTGAYFHLSDSPDAAAEFYCKLSADHNQLVISGGHLPVSMRHILEVKTLSDSDHHHGAADTRKRSGSHGKVISLELIYKSGGLEQKITLSPCTSHAKKAAADWLRALKKALIILHNT